MTETPMQRSEESRAMFAPNVQVFLYLQLLDALTTLLGFRVGLAEASPFVRLLTELGPIPGIMADKLAAILLAGVCIWTGRPRTITWINYWFAGLVTWNLGLILTRLL
jgi:hypothetical protein